MRILNDHIDSYRGVAMVYALFVMVTSTFAIVDGFVYPYPEDIVPFVRTYQSVSGAVFVLVSIAQFMIFFRVNFALSRYIVCWSTAVFVSTLTIMTGDQTDMDIIHAIILISSPFILFSWYERLHVIINIFFAVTMFIIVRYVVFTTGGLLTLPMDVIESGRFSNLVLAMLMGVYLSYNLYISDKFQVALIKERHRSDKLLRNVMPAKITERLKDNEGELVADNYSNISVLFADLKGFTSWCHGRKAEDTVQALNSLVCLWDEVVSGSGGEKIKTIGDGYMAAWGVPDEDENHALRATLAAFEMIDTLRGHELYERWGIEMRAGIHSGEVIAGVIGRDKFAYDIWGDTVNTASRMEQRCEPMFLTVSKVTADLLKKQDRENRFDFKSLGIFEIKGKGKMDLWQISKSKPGLS